MNAVVQKQAEMVTGTERITKASKEAASSQDETFGGASVARMATFATGLLSIHAAVGKVTEAYRSWRERIHEVSEASSKAMRDIVAFAALQEGGTKAARVTQASELAASYGVSDRGLAFDVVQSLQSAIRFEDRSKSDEQSWREALPASAEAFKLTQLGVSSKSAVDSVIQAMAQNVDPASFARKVYLAGEAGTRKPEDVAGAAKGMAFWDDKDFAAAAAAVISGEQAKTGSEGETEVYLRQAGRALSGVGDLATKKFWQKKGLAADASQEARLAKLVELGIDTPEEIQAAGVGDMREIKGVQTLVKNFASLRNIRDHITENDRPGLLEARRYGVEQEIPTAGFARDLDILKVMQDNQKALPTDTAMLEEERLARARALALRRMGMRGNVIGGGFEDDNGLVGPVDWWRATNFGGGFFAQAYSDDDFGAVRQRMQEQGLGGGWPGARDINQVLNVEVERILSELRDSANTMARAAETFNRTSSGGPTLTRPDEDR